MHARLASRRGASSHGKTLREPPPSRARSTADWGSAKEPEAVPQVAPAERKGFFSGLLRRRMMGPGLKTVCEEGKGDDFAGEEGTPAD